MILKSFAIALAVVFSAFGALALDLPIAPKKMQIIKDLQLADEVESLNDQNAGKVWIRQADDETPTQIEAQAELKGISPTDN